MLVFKNYIVALFALVLNYAAIAQPNQTFTNMSVKHGLPHGWIKCIEQDKLGFMWFGTNDGLCKYDGHNFEYFKYERGNDNSLWSNVITSLFADKNNNLIIGTSKGLNIYCTEKGIITRIKNTEFNVSNIVKLDSDNLLVSTYNGLLTLNSEFELLGHHLITEDRGSNKNRFRVVVAYKNKLLLFIQGGVYSFNVQTNKFVQLLADNVSFNGDEVRSAAIVNDTIIVGLRGDGLAYAPANGTKIFRKIEIPNLNSTTLFRIYNQGDTALVLGAENKGLVYLDLKKGIHNAFITKQILNKYAIPNALANNSVHCIFNDAQNNLWVGTYNGLSYQINEGVGFHYISQQIGNKNSLSNLMVSSVCKSNNLLWVGTENGLNVFNTNYNKVLNLKKGSLNNNGLLSSSIITLAADDEQNVWAGSWIGGIDIISPEGQVVKKITAGNNHNNISHNSVMNIVKDKKGNMWIGSNGGGVDVFLKKEQKFKRYKNELSDSSSLSNNWVISIMSTAANEIWIATHFGLDLFDEETDAFHRFYFNEKDSTSIASATVNCMHEDKAGNLWFGTTTGVCLFNRADSTFTTFNEKYGLQNSYIQSILSDNKGDIWLGTNAGLVKLVNGTYKSRNPEFEHFNTNDGLIGIEFIRRAAFKDKNGTLYFGTKKGLIYFSEGNVRANEYIPEIYLTELKVNNELVQKNNAKVIYNKHINHAEAIELEHDQSDLIFTFAALNYEVSSKNQYKYKLHGFDEEWIESGNLNKAFYTNIPPGNYLFQVVGSNNSGKWNNEGTKLSVIIHPPWHRTTLAFIAYVMLLAALILSYRYFIVKQFNLRSKLDVERLEKENLSRISVMKNKFFTNISHEFLTPLSLIISPLENIINCEDKLSANALKPIFRNAKRLQRLISQLLDISKIESQHLKLNVQLGNIHSFVHEIYINFKNFARTKEVDIEFLSSIKSEKLYFDSDKMEKILYNLLSNAIKFTPKEGCVKLFLGFDNNMLKIEVQDTGIGIDNNEQKLVFDSFYQSEHAKKSEFLGSGVGLNLVKGLVGVYGGIIKLESEKEKGSKFTLHLPYKQQQFDANAISEVYAEIESGLDLVEEFEPENVNVKYDDVKSFEEKVLIIEDNVELNSHLVDILSTSYNVTSGFNGEQGFELASELIPDIIIADIVMPKLSGIDMLKKIRINESTSHIPVILLTAKIDMNTQLEGLEFGADAYITKPFDGKHLKLTVVNLIKSRKHLKEFYKKEITIEPSKVKITSVDEKFIKKAISIVESNFTNESFSVEFLACEIGMSRVQLHRKLTALIGISATSFIRDIKVKRAAELITQGQLTISEAMFEVNLRSRNYFIKSFKETFNILPSEYITDYKKRKLN